MGSGVFVIDPYSISRAGIESLVADSGQLEIVGTANDDRSSSFRLQAPRADLITVAVDGGFDAHLTTLRRIRSKDFCAGAKVLLMYGIERQAEGWTAVRAGASGCVSLTLDRCSLIMTMLLAINGAVVFMPGPTGPAASPRVEETADEPSPLRAGLTDRERQVLALLGRGLSNCQIARELILAEATVKKHLTGAMRKIGKADRLGAGLYAVRRGIDDAPPRPPVSNSASGVDLVSVFYEAYRGRDEQFYQAQRLTRREKHHLNLHEAFLNIISGIEDLADAKEAAFDVITSDFVVPDGAPSFPFDHHNVDLLQRADAPDRAFSGLYLSTEPKLTLLPGDPVPAGETVSA